MLSSFEKSANRQDSPRADAPLAASEPAPPLRPRGVTFSAGVGIALGAGAILFALWVLSMLDEPALSQTDRWVIGVAACVVIVLGAGGILAGFATLRGAAWGRFALMAGYALLTIPLVIGTVEQAAVARRLGQSFPIRSTLHLLVLFALSASGILLLATPRARAWFARHR